MDIDVLSNGPHVCLTCAASLPCWYGGLGDWDWVLQWRPRSEKYFQSSFQSKFNTVASSHLLASSGHIRTVLRIASSKPKQMDPSPPD